MLNVMAGLLKIDGDSSGATKALQETKKESQDLAKNTNDLGGSFGAMVGKIAPFAVGVGALTAAFSFLKKSYSMWMEAHKESADLFSQFGSQAWFAASQIKGVQNELDNMLKIQTVARSYNLLVNSEIAASTEQIRSLGAMAINYARATGGNMDDAMNQLTDAVQKGKAKAFIPFGIILNNTRAEIEANAEALRKFGRVASEEEVQIKRSQAALEHIHQKYKEVQITVGDINEIEAKQTNRRKANMAIAAKMTEGYAMQLQKLRHDTQDAMDTVFNSVNGLSARQKDIQKIMFAGMADMLPQVAASIRGDGEKLKQEMIKIESEIEAIKEAAGRDTDSGQLLTTKEQDKQIAALEARLSALGRVNFQLPTKQFDALKTAMAGLGDVSTLSNEALKKQGEEFLKIQKEAQNSAEALKLWEKMAAEMGKTATTGWQRLQAQGAQRMADQAKAYKQSMDDMLEKSKETTEALTRENTSRDITETLGKGEEVIKRYQDGQKSILDMSKIAAEIEAARLQKKLDYNNLQEDEKLRVASIKANLESQADTLSRQLAEMEAQISVIQNAEKGGHKLSSQEKARLELLKQQYSQMQKQEGSILSQITSLISFMKGIKTDDVKAQAKGQAEAWVKEYNQTMKILSGKNDDAKAGVVAKYGTDDPKLIKEKMRMEARNKDLTALEKKYADEIIKIEKERSEAEFAQIEARGVAEENEKKRRQDEIKAELKDESDRLTNLINPRINYEEKIKELSNTRKVSTDEQLKIEKDSLAKQIESIENAQDQLESRRQKLLASDGLTIEQEKEFASLQENLLKKEYELRKEYKDKTIALKKEENKELKALAEQIGNDLKGYGESLIKTTGGAMWEAMTISNAALAESHMSRSEMQRRAIKEELENIAKQAFIQSLWEGAKSIASYAVGDAKGGSMHAAAALAYGAIAGTSYALSKGISAPSDAEIARRKEKAGETPGDMSTGAASVAGASSGGKTVVINVYWPQGMLIGDKDAIAKAMNNATQDAMRRGKL